MRAKPLFKFYNKPSGKRSVQRDGYETVDGQWRVFSMDPLELVLRGARRESSTKAYYVMHRCGHRGLGRMRWLVKLVTGSEWLIDAIHIDPQCPHPIPELVEQLFGFLRLT